MNVDTVWHEAKKLADYLVMTRPTASEHYTDYLTLARAEHFTLAHTAIDAGPFEWACCQAAIWCEKEDPDHAEAIRNGCEQLRFVEQRRRRLGLF